MRGVALALAGMLLATGCPDDKSTGGGGSDAGIEPDAAAPPTCSWPLPPHNFDPCEVPEPTDELVLDQEGTYVLDTSGVGSLVDPAGAGIILLTATIELDNGTEALLISTTAFRIDEAASLRVAGDRPVIIMAGGTDGEDGSAVATVSGTISVASRLVQGVYVDGPGGNLDPACVTSGTGHDPVEADGGGGGGGGGFGANGGGGGKGNSGASSAGAAGEVSATPSLDILRGGCAGGHGAPLDNMNISAPGGAGGAIQIAARDRVLIDGVIDAGGGGGSGGLGAGNGGNGAGGGGSGGGILIDAAAITLNGASLCANGGSGGEGATSSPGAATGTPGTCSNLPAETTKTSDACGDGGDGGYGDVPSGGSGGAGETGYMAGGGGGGGSVGVIQLHTVEDGLTKNGAALVSPAETLDVE